MRRKLLIIFATLLALAHTPEPAGAWTAEQTRLGGENHPKILAEFGGETDNLALAGYIDGIGRVIVRRTQVRDEPWTFTVLDSPVVNAFAVPGGYIYLTRGLVGLANSEAEIAAVIGHEVAHLTRRHVERRQNRAKGAGIGVLAGTILGAVLDGKDGIKQGIQLSSRVASGYVAQHSQQQEFEADETGIRFLANAGYDPHAQSRFLASMAAKAKVEAAIAGGEYNPNRVDFFASHPATGDRVRRAAATANKHANTTNALGQGAYFAMVDGLVYGDSARQGFVRGRTFRHPELRFVYRVPEGYRITNSARQVVAQSQQGGRMILQGGGKAEVAPLAFLQNTWLPAIKRSNDIRQTSKAQAITLNGLPAARIHAWLDRNGKPYMAEFVAISHRGRFHLLSGIAPGSNPAVLGALRQSTETFRPLSAAEAAQERPYRLRIHKVRSGDTVQSLAATLPGPRKLDMFRALNGLTERSQLNAGDRVKLIGQ